MIIIIAVILAAIIMTKRATCSVPCVITLLVFRMEAQTGFEPAFLSETMDLQSSTLPLGHRALRNGFVG